MNVSTELIKTRILPAMIVAPSAHNTQPWFFSIQEGVIDVFIDPTRDLTVSDPTRRQMYISLGSTIENALVAATHLGYRANLSYFPEGHDESRVVARILLTHDGTEGSLASLYEAIDNRRTDRSLYDDQPLTANEKAALDTLNDPTVHIVEDRGRLEKLAALTSEGSFVTLSRPEFKRELSHWVRNSWTRKPDGMPGYAMGMPALVALVAPYIIPFIPIQKQEQANTGKQMIGSSAAIIFSGNTDNPEDWLRAGQHFERLWLEATAAGLAAAPMAAAIEGGEKYRAQVQEMLGTKMLPHAILRIGHSARGVVKASPRRTIEDCLKSNDSRD